MDKLPLCQLNGLSNNGTIEQLSGVPQSQKYISTMSCMPWSSMEKHLSDDQSLPHSDPTKNKIILVYLQQILRYLLTLWLWDMLTMGIAWSSMKKH